MNVRRGGAPRHYSPLLFSILNCLLFLSCFSFPFPHFFFHFSPFFCPPSYASVRLPGSTESVIQTKADYLKPTPPLIRLDTSSVIDTWSHPRDDRDYATAAESLDVPLGGSAVISESKYRCWRTEKVRHPRSRHFPATFNSYLTFAARHYTGLPMCYVEPASPSALCYLSLSWS